jgi:hypothetical protein
LNPYPVTGIGEVDGVGVRVGVSVLVGVVVGSGVGVGVEVSVLVGVGVSVLVGVGVSVLVGVVVGSGVGVSVLVGVVVTSSVAVGVGVSVVVGVGEGVGGGTGSTNVKYSSLPTLKYSSIPTIIGLINTAGVGVGVGVVVGVIVGVEVTLNVGVGVGVTITQEFQNPLFVRYVDAAFPSAKGAGGPPTNEFANCTNDSSVKSNDLLNPTHAVRPTIGVGLSQLGTGNAITYPFVWSGPPHHCNPPKFALYSTSASLMARSPT